MIKLNNNKSFGILKYNNYNFFNIGDFVSLTDTITFYSLVKEPLSQFILQNNSLKLTNFHLGSDYFLKLDFDSLSSYNSFLFFGFNPRYEASLLNTCLARLTENNDSSFFQFNTGMSNFFSVSHKGGHHKNIKNFFEGRFSFLNTLRLEKNVKLLYGANHFKHLKKSENIFNFLASKFSNKPTFITHDLSTLSYLEFFGGSMKQSFNMKTAQRNDSSKKNNWSFNNSLQPSIKDYSNTIQLGIRTKNINNHSSKATDISIPIKFFYENNDISLNIFGKAIKTEKVSNNESSSIFSLRNWLLFFFLFSLEDYSSFYDSLIYKKKEVNRKKSKQLDINLFKVTFLHNLNFYNLINYFTNLNVYNNNTEEFLHSFSIRTFLKFHKNYFLYNYVKLNILNFYLNYDFLSYSFTMTNSSFLHSDNLFLK